MKLTKPAILQILFDILLACWIMALIFQTTLLFLIPIVVIVPACGVVVCWGQIRIRGRKP